MHSERRGNIMRAAGLIVDDADPMVNVPAFIRLCGTSGIKIEEGECHNRTRGYVNFVLSCNGKTHDLHANWQDGTQYAWVEALEWIGANGRHDKPKDG